MAKTILVVDDKASLCNLIKEYLTEEGFRVVTAENGRQALYVARHEKPDLILLDIMMPEMDGHAFMRAYRQERDTPIILLTAKLEESDKVLGLELGADDYVTKPFSPREPVARVRAVLRRMDMRRMDKGAPLAEVLRVAGITLDNSARLVQVSGKDVRLTASSRAIARGCATACSSRRPTPSRPCIRKRSI
jgi:DNA-binding response OmpR family regulator